jgi:hypothetical protein
MSSLQFLGMVSRDKKFFLQGLKNQISAFCILADSFQNIWLPFGGENL